MSEGGEKNGGGGKEIWEPVTERAGFALEEGREHEVGVWASIEKAGVTGEENACAGASESYE